MSEPRPRAPQFTDELKKTRNEPKRVYESFLDYILRHILICSYSLQGQDTSFKVPIVTIHHFEVWILYVSPEAKRQYKDLWGPINWFNAVGNFWIFLRESQFVCDFFFLLGS